MSYFNRFKRIVIMVVAVICFFLLGYNCYPIINNKPKSPSVPSESASKATETVIKESSEVTVTPKVTSEDPDLIVDTKYTAQVNGEEVVVPYQSTKFPKGTQTSIKSTIDLTPVVKKMADSEYKRNWEVGLGVGLTHDKEFYVPLSLQRNYNYDRAVEVQVGLAKDHIENIQVSHKWKF